jgi:hypothetical protein
MALQIDAWKASLAPTKAPAPVKTGTGDSKFSTF